MYCSGQATICEADARAQMLEKGLVPLDPYPGLNRPWRSNCLAEGHETSPTLSNARKTRQGCKFCAERAFDATVADKIMRQAGYLPLVEFPGVAQPWLSVHLSCGREVQPTLDKIKNSKRTPCRYCAEYGFDLSRPGYLYLLMHEGYRATKIGIYNEGNGRLGEHRRRCWQLVRQELMSGVQAVKAEALVLGRWLDLDLPEALSKEHMPQGGWTETVSFADRPLDAVIADFVWAVWTTHRQ